MNEKKSITPRDVEAEISSETYGTAADLGDLTLSHARGGIPVNGQLDRVTICVLVLQSGFVVVGVNAAPFAENFDAKRGREEARKDAIRQIWPLLGFARVDRMHREVV